MSRKVPDCRLIPSDVACTLTIAGEEEEVLDAAVQHAVAHHGHEESPELREQLRAVLIAEAPAVTMNPSGR
jgi:predicted small metal-binding protein